MGYIVIIFLVRRVIVSCRYDVYLSSSSWCNVYLCMSDSDKQKIFNQREKIKSIVVNMLQNWSYIFSSHNSNIKFVSSIINYIGFEPIDYVTP